MNKDEWMLLYHTNQFPPKLRPFARAQYLHLRDGGARPLPENYGLEPWEVSDLIIKLAQVRPEQPPTQARLG
jgi:hypothetical protein